MQIILIVLGYLKWHYGKAICSLSSIWKNFLFFIYEFFSIKLLTKNFFDSWKRMTDSYPKSFDFKKYAYIFLNNLITRMVGMIMRLFLIIIGLTCYIIFALLYIFVLIGWILLPLIITILISVGIFLIIK